MEGLRTLEDLQRLWKEEWSAKTKYSLKKMYKILTDKPYKNCVLWPDGKKYLDFWQQTILVGLA